MTETLRDDKGRYAGSIGAGKTRIPSPNAIPKVTEETVTSPDASIHTMMYSTFKELTQDSAAHDPINDPTLTPSRSSAYGDELHNLLLTLGGHHASIDLFDDDLPAILQDGHLMEEENYPVVVMENGVPSQCHRNCSAIWRSGEWQGYICTGYALYEGVWLPHSWMLDDQDCIYETTTLKREKYFGVILDGETAGSFAWKNM